MGRTWRARSELLRSCTLINEGVARNREQFKDREGDVISELEDVCERAANDQAAKALEMTGHR